MKYTDSYDDRQSVPDMADEAMQKYLKDANLVEFKDWLKIGTDPKENKLDLFWYVTKVLLIPDYVVKVGLFYFKHPGAEPKWYSAEKIYDLWIDPRTEEGHYPEKDVDGKPKLYKVLPSV